MKKKVLVVSCLIDSQSIINRYVQDRLIPDCEFSYLIEFYNDELPSDSAEGFFPVKDFADHKNLNQVIADISTRNRFDAVISLDEFSVYVAALVREWQNISGMSVAEARCFRDKLEMKKCLKGTEIPYSKPISYEALKAKDFNFPIIVKPRSMAGAVGVSILRNLDDWKQLWTDTIESTDRSYRDMDDHQMICEDFLEGPVLHFDYALQNGEMVFSSLSKYVNTPAEYIGGMPLGSYILEESEVPTHWVQTCKQIAKAFPVFDGVYHLELIGEFNETPSFLELGFRPGGGFIKDAIHNIMGIDLLAAHICLQLQQDFNFKQPRRNESCGFLIFPKQFESELPSFVLNAELPQHTFQSKLVKSFVPRPGVPASGEFYDHIDTLGSFAFQGSSSAINLDFQWTINNYNLKVGPQ